MRMGQLGTFPLGPYVGNSWWEDTFSPVQWVNGEASAMASINGLRSSSVQEDERNSE